MVLPWTDLCIRAGSQQPVITLMHPFKVHSDDPSCILSCASPGRTCQRNWGQSSLTGPPTRQNTQVTHSGMAIGIGFIRGLRAQRDRMHRMESDEAASSTSTPGKSLEWSWPSFNSGTRQGDASKNSRLRNASSLPTKGHGRTP